MRSVGVMRCLLLLQGICECHVRSVGVMTCLLILRGICECHVCSVGVVTVLTTGGLTSWEVVWFDKFLEKFVGTSHLVQVICVWNEPELEDSALLKPQRQVSSH